MYVFALLIDTSGLGEPIISTHQRVCYEAFCAMFYLGCRVFKRKAANPVISAFSRFLEEKEEEDEPIPTRSVREAVRETFIHDHDDKAIYLSTVND
jgi:hypothetical protein